MRVLLFNLQGVPEEEAEGFRAILHEHNIFFYETYAGRWRIGLAGIWLPDEQQKEEALALRAAYQEQVYQEAQNEGERLKRLGFYQAILEQWYKEPLKMLMSIVGIILVLFISIYPFTNL